MGLPTDSGKLIALLRSEEMKMKTKTWIASRHINKSHYGIHKNNFTEFESPEIICEVKNKRDARLIAAAPDLLDALKKMYEVYAVLAKKNHTLDDSRMMDARQAIAKAEGKYK